MADLQNVVAAAMAAALDKFASIHLRPDEVAVALSVPTTETKLQFQIGLHRGHEPCYPASVIKLFYLAAAHRWLEDKRIADTPELRRALRDMIVDSSNDATGYVVDVLTDTTSGPELPPAELAVWQEKRNLVNQYFKSLGYSHINANRKTWNDGPYGRDKQAVDQFTPARNSLTAEATARLLAEIATGRCVTPARSQQMLDLLRREFAPPATRDYQAREFSGPGLPPSAKLWSKAGDMSAARHDAAIVELADGRRFVLVVFTTRPDSKAIIPEIVRQIVRGFGGAG
jgi:hypothetical protein